MSDGIVLRLAVDSDALGAVLDRLPGVAVVDDLADPTAADTTDDADDGEPPTDDAEPGRLAALVGEWGLLGLGVGFVGLGLATVALWWTRRGDDAEPEIVPGGADESVSTVLDERTAEDGEAVGDTAVPAGTDDGHTVDRGPPAPEQTTTDPGAHTDSSGEADGDAVDGTAGRAREEGDSGESAAADAARGDVADEGGVEDEGASGERAPDERESEDDADVLRRGDVDPAPLIGAAFLAVVGVVVRWLGGAEGSD